MYYCWRNDKFQITDVRYDHSQLSYAITMFPYMEDQGTRFTCCCETVHIDLGEFSHYAIQTRTLPFQKSLRQCEGDWALLLHFQ